MLPLSEEGTALKITPQLSWPAAGSKSFSTLYVLTAQFGFALTKT